MVKDRYGGYYLLELPNCKWGAVWDQGINDEWGKCVLHGDYEFGCASVGNLKTVVSFIKNIWIKN